jgi:hypothetical protein
MAPRLESANVSREVSLMTGKPYKAFAWEARVEAQDRTLTERQGARARRAAGPVVNVTLAAFGVERDVASTNMAGESDGSIL